jgi:hypothetical protein
MSRKSFGLIGIFGFLVSVLLTSSIQPEVVRASSCFIHSNCVYDLDTENGDDLVVFGETIKYVACFSGAGRTRLEVKENGKWSLAARSRVKVDVKKCGRKYKYRHVYTWQVDVLPSGEGEKLQMRLVSGRWKRLWVQPVAESQEEVLNGIALLARCIEKRIHGLPCD